MFHKCDVSKWEEVEAVAKTIVEQVRALEQQGRG